AASGTLTFAAGETSKTVTVPVLGNTIDQSDRSFTVLLTNPVNGTLAKATGSGVILDNDPAITISSVSVVEGDAGSTPAVFTVSLSNPKSVATTVSYQTVSGTATAGVDYVAMSGTLTFAPGDTSKTITISV